MNEDAMSGGNGDPVPATGWSASGGNDISHLVNVHIPLKAA